MASALSHRQMVTPLMEATIPRRTASRAMSAELRRDRGKPSSAGSAHARALTSMTIRGGKGAGPPAPRTIAQTVESLMEEAFWPLADDLTGEIQSPSDLVVRDALSGKQDDPGPDDITIRRRISICGMLQMLSLLLRDKDCVRRLPGHIAPPRWRHDSARRARMQPSYVILFVRTCTKAFAFALTDPSVRLSRTRLFRRVTRGLRTRAARDE